ncbi:type II toxin-antitoxin system RelE/ParE family toxin [Acidaminobacter sp. JC074]|uniref:type II toxin-antitoxin system RelE/ParE family toxin n=1 Tax=Acidaminobacter sp. JC074 TaxID=2530199 RepID=UPI001F0D48D8|nr:type II toxin-antitoxin system RelE/ParE family toxin [Acidaminobacter sp. JC074]
MDRYKVMLKQKALDDIDSIYEYIALGLQNTDAALKLVDDLEAAIFSLENLPYRGTERKIGMFAYKGYRQLFINNFTIIYRVNQKDKQVVIVHVIYSKRDL